MCSSDLQVPVLVGHSRGGGLALIHAAESGTCRGVVTWAAVATFDRFDEPTKELWRRDGFDKDKQYDTACLYERLKAKYPKARASRGPAKVHE